MTHDHAVVTKARLNLILNTKPSAAFLATLALRLTVVERADIGTFATDGTSLFYNPAFAATLTAAEVEGVVAHEVLHCAFLHVFRRQGRDARLYNIAADHVINLLLRDWGYTLPAGGYCDAQYAGWSVEQVYGHLLAQQPPQNAKNEASGGQGGGNPQPGASDASQGAPDGKNQGPGASSVLPGCPTGEFWDAPAPEAAGGEGANAASTYTEHDWAVAAEQAAMTARLAGTAPGSLTTSLKQSRNAEYDWRSELREFVSEQPTEQSWARPARRYMQSMYLPSQVRDRIGELVLILDTSGSMRGPLLSLCSQQITTIAAELQPERITVLYVDTRVRRVETYEPGDEIVLQAQGGGGTRFQPAFDWIEQEGISPLAVVYLTDLENGGEKLTEPTYPVIWATPNFVTLEPQFGRVVRVG